MIILYLEEPVVVQWLLPSQQSLFTAAKISLTFMCIRIPEFLYSNTNISRR